MTCDEIILDLKANASEKDMWINKIGWGALLEKYYVSDTMMRKYRKVLLREQAAACSFFAFVDSNSCLS